MRLIFKIEYRLYVFGILVSGALLLSCSPVASINKLNKAGYTFIVNHTDTLKFDKLFLDDNLDNSLLVDKKQRTISFNTTSKLHQLVSIRDIEKICAADSTKVAFIIFDGTIYDTSASDEIVYFQMSLITQIDRIKRGSLDGIGCRPPKGDIIIIQ